MRYLVEVAASMERGNAIEAAGGPGPLLGHIVERFKPEAEIAELMYMCTYVAGTDPKFTPVITLSEAASVLPGAIQNAKKALGL